MLLIWRAQLELLILTAPLIQGKTANAFLSPPQSLVRGESVCSPSSPCTRSQSCQPLWFLRGMFSFLPNALCSLQWGNGSLEAEELICESLGYRDDRWRCSWQPAAIWEGHRPQTSLWDPKGHGGGSFVWSEFRTSGVHPEK